MSGTANTGALRDSRQVMPQAGAVAGVPGIAEVSTRDARMAVGYEAQGIAQVLDPLERQITQAIGQDSQRRAEADAGATHFTRDENNRLVPPDIEPSFMESAYGKRRRELLSARYAAELVTDSDAAMVRMRGESNRDPAAFLASAEGYRNGMTASMPASLREPVTQALNHVIAGNHRDMLGQQLQVEQQSAAARVTSAAEVMATEVRDLAIQAPGEQRDGAMAAATARTARYIESNRAVLGGTETEALLRRLVVLNPIDAALRGHLLRNPDGQGGSAPAPSGPVPEALRPARPEAQAVGASILQQFPAARVTSVVRTGAGEHQHGEGTAFDLSLAGMSQPERERLVRGVLSGTGPFANVRGIGTYNATGDVLHVDTRAGPVAAWGPNRSRTSLGETPAWFQSAVADWQARPAPAPGATPTPAAAPSGDVVAALLGGPGTPGWQPAWGQLTDPERANLARYASSVINTRRGDISYNQAQQAHSQQVTAAGFLLRAAQFADAGAPDPTGARVALHTEVLAAARSGAINGAGAASILRTLGVDDRQYAQDQSHQAAAVITTEFAGQRLAAIEQTTNPNVVRINDDPNLSSVDKAHLLNAETARLEEAGRALARQQQPTADVQAALAGTLRLTTPAHERAVVTVLDAANSGPAAWSSTVADTPTEPSRTTMAANVARMTALGRMPTELRAFFQPNGGAFASETAFRNAAAIFSAVMNNPEAEREMRAGIGAQTMAAWEETVRRVAMMPPERNTTEQNGQSAETGQIMQRTQDMARRGPRSEGEINASLGTTVAEQNTARDRLMIDALGLPEHWWTRAFSSLPNTIGAPYHAALTSAFNHMAQFYPDGKTAMTAAVGSLSNTWGPSSTSLASTAGGFGNTGPGGARMVMFPPEKFTAPLGAGGTPGTAWQEVRVNELLAERGVPQAQSRGDGGGPPVGIPFRLGVNAVWQFDEVHFRSTGQVRHQILYQDPREAVPAFQPLTVAGSAQALRVDLGAEAAVRQREYDTNRQTHLRERQPEVAARATEAAAARRAASANPAFPSATRTRDTLAPPTAASPAAPRIGH